MARRKHKGPTPAREWVPLRRSTPVRGGKPRAEGLRPGEEQYASPHYIAFRQVLDLDAGVAGPLMLTVRNRANSAVRDWRDLQRIKNQLAGPEREAVELYPAESRLVDTANQYWLWVLPEGESFPFGFTERVVFGPEGPDGELRERYAEQAESLGLTIDELIRRTGQRRFA